MPCIFGTFRTHHVYILPIIILISLYPLLKNPPRQEYHGGSQVLSVTPASYSLHSRYSFVVLNKGPSSDLHNSRGKTNNSYTVSVLWVQICGCQIVFTKRKTHHHIFRLEQKYPRQISLQTL